MSSDDATLETLKTLDVKMEVTKSIRFTTFRKGNILHIVIEFSREEDARQNENLLTPGMVASLFTGIGPRDQP